MNSDDITAPDPGPTVAARGLASLLLHPTLSRQCWGFMIGASLFALGSAPGFSSWAGSSASNICYFVGAWGFTYAGFLQWIMSGPRSTEVRGRVVVRAAWLAAAAQSIGTILFNVSTSAALQAHTIPEQQHLVWTPDAAGSVAFLVSGAFVMRAYRHAHRAWEPSKAEWWSSQINMVGCIAFGASAVGAFIMGSGDSFDVTMANVGTFVGAVCFFLASLVVLPYWSERRTATR